MRRKYVKCANIMNTGPFHKYFISCPHYKLSRDQFLERYIDKNISEEENTVNLSIVSDLNKLKSIAFYMLTVIKRRDFSLNLFFSYFILLYLLFLIL